MKICILGDKLFINEFKDLSLKLSKSNIVSVPIIDYYKDEKNKTLKEDYYSDIREKIFNCDLIILIYESKKDPAFIFTFGIIFASKKNFKMVSIEKLRDLIYSKKE